MPIVTLTLDPQNSPFGPTCLFLGSQLKKLNTKVTGKYYMV